MVIRQTGVCWVWLQTTSRRGKLTHLIWILIAAVDRTMATNDPKDPIDKAKWRADKYTEL